MPIPIRGFLYTKAGQTKLGEIVCYKMPETPVVLPLLGFSNRIEGRYFKAVQDY